jgi:hypothetical protein
MLASPKWAIYGPNEPPPASAGPSRTIARLIRERPVFVNLAKAAAGNEFIGQNCMEIMGFRTRREAAARRCRRSGTLPQPRLFETAHLRVHISTAAGFSLREPAFPAARRKCATAPTLSNCNLTDSRAGRIFEKASQ